MLHGCRQLVAGAVTLSCETSATLIPCYTFTGDCPRKREEGEDDVKSACPLCPGPHTRYNGRVQWVAKSQDGNIKQISEISPQFRLGAAIRPHEVGIASNRESAGRGEYVLASCTK